MTHYTDFFPVAALGYQTNYLLTRSGELIDPSFRPVSLDKRNTVYLKTADGKPCRRSVRTLYLQAFGKYLAQDTIENLPGEIWEPIDEQNKYFISSCGRAKSYAHRTAQLLKPITTAKGYLRIDLRGIGCGMQLLHRLVALAFIPNDDPLRKLTIDHIDGNKSNNNVSNLRWLSIGDNVRAYQELKKQRESADNGSCGNT